MDQQKQKVVHEIKVSKPLMVFLWVMGIGIVFQQPVGKMLIPEAMAGLCDGSSINVNLWTPAPLDIQQY
jgi:hypothetical protein